MKTYNTHTPGPWKIGTGDLICTQDATWMHEGNPMIVAKVLRYGGTRPTEANARLICAAPDLLAACKKALETIQGQAEMLRALGAAYGIGATLAALESAISKAERGEA